MAVRIEVRPAPAFRSQPPAGVRAGSSWAQFGDDVVVYDHGSDTGARAAVPAAAGAADAQPGELYVVVQNGRLFQHHHPQVEVLHDRGRILLVAMAPQDASALDREGDPCYAITRLQPEEIVFSRSAAAAGAKDPSIQQIVDRISRQEYETRLRDIASAPTRFSTSEHFRATAERASATLQALGYVVTTQTFPVAGGSSLNVVAARPAAADDAEILIVTAHLDSINLDAGPLGAAPGADDNGSGAAGVLELARVFAAENPGPHALRFILFGGEEQGLFGSRHYVASLTQAERARVRAVVNMDMIGRLNQPRRTVLLEGAVVSQRVIDALAQAAVTYGALEVETSLKPAASDHVPFIKAAMPAVLTIEGADGTNTAIHSDRDKLDTIDYELALAILRTNAAFIAAELRSPL